MSKVDDKKIEELLTRGVEKIYPDKESLERVLKSGKKIRLYNGIDPTGRLHLGHLIVLRKLRQFQDLGHEVIVLMGNFTATIGDPTDKAAARKPLTGKEVMENAKSYKGLIGKILDLKKTNVRFLYNEKWDNALSPAQLLEIFSYFNVARLLERDMFRERIKRGKNILLHEFVYPVFQAYDSVAMDVDLEVGGNDQTFNMLQGRDLMEKMGKKEKFVMALKLLTDPSGKKMGKTEENSISLGENPKEIFGKIMSWPDSLLTTGLELLTGISSREAKGLLDRPKNAKIHLAKEVVQALHGQKASDSAEKEFNRIFKEKKLPTRIPEIKISEKSLLILDLLIKTKLAFSKSEAKRLIVQGGVKIDEEVQKDWKKKIKIKKGQVVQIGKRKFVKIG